jgi:hypothetical protein
MKAPSPTITFALSAFTAERLASLAQNLKETKAKIDAIEAARTEANEEVFMRLSEVLQAHEDGRRADVRRGLLDLMDIFDPRRGVSE